MLKCICVLTAALATLGICALLVTGRLPLGIPDEWEWGKIESSSRWPEALVAGLAATAYLVFVWFGWHWVAGGRPWTRRAAVAALVPAGFVVQMALQLPGYGLAKWPMVLFNFGSSGYYTVARTEGFDASDFLAHYDQFQKRQDPFHLGTHPPGLILLHYGALRWCEANPRVTHALLSFEPQGVRDGFRVVVPGGRLPPTDEASLWLVALVTQLASALTVVPLYWLARRTSGPGAAWGAVAMCPLVPAVALFCPKSDVLYSLLATTCVAVSLSGRSLSARSCCAVLAGLVLWIGLFLSLALVTVVPVIVLATVLAELPSWKKALLAISQRLAALVAGVLIPTAVFWVATDHNLLATWKECYRKHAEFYKEMPRSYWPWVGFNLAEFAVAMGVPLFVAAVAGTVLLGRRCRTPRPQAPASMDSESAVAGGGAGRSSETGGGDPSPNSAGALVWAWWATVLALDLSGKNLGEVARLWIFLIPFAVPAAAAALERLGNRPWLALVLQLSLGLQTIVFVSNVQGFMDPRSIKIPGQNPEIRGQKSEIRSQRSEVNDQDHPGSRVFAFLTSDS